MRSRSTSLLVAALVTGAIAGSVSDATGSRVPPAPAPAAGGTSTGAVRAGLDRLPVSFVANQGRWDTRAAWVASGPEATAYFVDAGVRWALPGQGDGPGWALDQALVGARAARPVASVAAPGVVSYFGEGAHTSMPTAAELTLAEAWPGIDVVWSGTGGQVEATYRLAPGADPAQVRVAWRGADGLAVTDDGTLSVTTPVRTFEEDAPKAFQDVGGTRVPVDVAFDLDGTGSYGFRLGSYDPALALVIDPTTLLYAGFLGGSGNDDLGRGIAVDGAGNAYVTGWTNSTAATFPETPGAFQPANAGFHDAFVAKVNPAGTTLAYATFLGSNDLDFAMAIAVDGAGNAYVTGSAGATFPVTPGAFRTTVDKGGAFVAKLNPAGTALVYSTFLGGAFGRGIAVDGAGNAYVTGDTGSSDTFPVTPGAFQPDHGGVLDAFVTKVNPTGTALVYSTLLGGSRADVAHAIAVDGAGNAYVTGETLSGAAGFPVTAGAFQVTSARFGVEDAFVAKVSPTGSSLLYASFLGGGGFDYGLGIAVDAAGNAYVTGQTNSTAATFPETPGVFQGEKAGPEDAFVAKVNPTGSALVYAGFLGGDSVESGEGIAVDAAGNAYVTGWTGSGAATFPSTPEVDNAGFRDAFVAKVGPTGSALVAAAFIGGSGSDAAYGIAVDGAGAAYVTGETGSTAATFPETPGAFQTESAGPDDAFVAKVVLVDGPPLRSVIAGSTFFVDGTSARTGPAARIALFATGAEPGFTYRLVSGRDGGNAAQPCSTDVVVLNPAPKYAGAGGVIGITAGVLDRPPGTWQVCFRSTDPGVRAVTAAASYTIA